MSNSPDSVTISRRHYQALWGAVLLLVVGFAFHHYTLVVLPERALRESRGEGEQSFEVLVPEEAELISGAPLLETLRRGGFVLYLRHFQSDHAKWHVDPIKRRHGELALEDFADCSQQRPLSNWGRDRARRVGEIIRGHGVPIGTLRASPYCRVVEGIELAFQRPPDEVLKELIYRGGTYTREQMSRSLLPHLTRRPSPGTNDVVMAHKSNVEDLGSIAEGETWVFEPRGDTKFALVARILDHEWFESLVDVKFLGAAAATGGEYH